MFNNVPKQRNYSIAWRAQTVHHILSICLHCFVLLIFLQFRNNFVLVAITLSLLILYFSVLIQLPLPLKKLKKPLKTLLKNFFNFLIEQLMQYHKSVAAAVTRKQKKVLWGHSNHQREPRVHWYLGFLNTQEKHLLILRGLRFSEESKQRCCHCPREIIQHICHLASGKFSMETNTTILARWDL